MRQPNRTYGSGSECLADGGLEFSAEVQHAFGVGLEGVDCQHWLPYLNADEAGMAGFTPPAPAPGAMRCWRSP